MVASANLWAPIHAPVRANATLDFQAAPAYVGRASAVIEAALDHAAAHDVRVIRAYASAEARQDVLREAGLRCRKSCIRPTSTWATGARTSR